MRDYLIRVPEASQYAAHKAAYEVLDKQERPLYRYEPSMNAAVVRAPFEIKDALPLRSVEWDQGGAHELSGRRLNASRALGDEPCSDDLVLSERTCGRRRESPGVSG